MIAKSAIRPCLWLVVVTLLLAHLAPLVAAELPPTSAPFIVDIVPQALSGETNQDSEPSLAVDPLNPKRMVATAFTPNPFGAADPLAPVYVSVDGGNTWTLNAIVPTEASETGTADITVSLVSFANSPATLFAGILPRVGSLFMNALKADDLSSSAPMTTLESRDSADQPYIKAFTGAHGTQVYLGANFLGASDGRTATVDVSIDGGKSFTSILLERRPTSGQDLPSVRLAVGPNGDVYATFLALRSADSDSGDLLGDVVVMKDGVGATAARFEELREATDSVPGVIAVPNRPLWRQDIQLGLQRVGGQLAIATSPTDPLKLYISWGEFSTTGYGAALASSNDGGKSWQVIKNHPLDNVTNVSLAVAANGTVGLLYQQFLAAGQGQWAVRLEQSANDFTDFSSTTLALVPAD